MYNLSIISILIILNIILNFINIKFYLIIGVRFLKFCLIVNKVLYNVKEIFYDYFHRLFRLNN